MKVTLADPERVHEIAELFNDYRRFYQQEPDLEGALAFLMARFENKDSVIYTSSEGSRLAGFVQLYPSYSSVSMKSIWILNDLFVAEPYRRKGIARELLEAVNKHAQTTEALRIQCATQIVNVAAQRLYESLGYLKDEDFYHYSLSLEK